jgi:hypothetical protein
VIIHREMKDASIVVKNAKSQYVKVAAKLVAKRLNHRLRLFVNHAKNLHVNLAKKKRRIAIIKKTVNAFL